MPTRSKRGSAGRTRSRRSSQRSRQSSSRARRTTSRRASRGNKSSESKLKYAKWIESADDHEERHGQSLATRNHDVIRQWADNRKASPATAGQQRESSVGVLRMDFPGYGGKRLREVSWDEWFQSFDNNKLVFLFQEHKADGSLSNFFKLNRQK